MSLRVTNLRLGIAEPEAALPRRLASALGVLPADLHEWRILRKSLDLRDKHSLKFVYNCEVRLPGDETALARKAAIQSSAKVELYEEPPFEMPPHGLEPLQNRPVVVGSGPAGLVCAYFLAEQGYQPVVLERGTPVSQRIRDVKEFDAGGKFEPESNYLFGEGGAGTFSDGKLTCRSSGPDMHRVLELFADCKGQQPGKPSILYYHRPHLGSNRLPAVVKAIRQRIIDFGGEVRFHCKVEDLHISDGRLSAVVTNTGTLPTDAVILATGHSARDVYTMLHNRGVPLVQKPFQMGLRVEHSQETVNRVQFGPVHHEELLGNADYTILAHGSADVFSFCMCAGGYIIPSVSREGYFCTNGMSLSRRDSPFANSGLVVTLPVSEFGSQDLLAGIAVQEHFEKLAYEMGGGDYRCPVQLAIDFLSGKRTSTMPRCSYPRKLVGTDLHSLLPPYVAAAIRDALPAFDRMWHKRFLNEAVLVGPELRGSSPVRIVREEESRSSPGIPGLYPIGEGAGYAGGIVSAAVDGLRTAKAFVSKYAPFRR